MAETRPCPDQLFGTPKIPRRNTSSVTTMTISFQRKFLFMMNDQTHSQNVLQRLLGISAGLFYLLTAGSSAVVTVTIDPRLTSNFRLSGGTRSVIESSLIEKIVPFNPPLVTTLSPVLRAPNIACHFFWRRCWGRIRRK